MASKDDQPQFIDEHHQRFVEFADAYLDEEDREAFVDGLLEKHGYQRETHWAPPPPDPNKRPGAGGKRPGFYGGKR